MQEQTCRNLLKKFRLTDFSKGHSYIKPILIQDYEQQEDGIFFESHNIEINKKHYEEFGIEELIGIIKHELCHYHLHIEKRGYKHRDQDFKELLKK